LREEWEYVLGEALRRIRSSEFTMHRPSFLACLVLAGLLAEPALAADPVALPAYGADSQQTSVSGLSAGAYMAVQLQVAYSHSIVGAGVIAGGPYYCAANNLVLYGEICLGQVPILSPDPVLLANAAKGFASAHAIDALSNLGKRRIYVFSGTDDNIVLQSAVDATVSFFRLVGVKDANISYVNTVPAGHAVITPSFGNECSANAAPYISHCKVAGTGYDQAGALLQQIYGALNPRIDAPTGQRVTFNQRAYASAATGMAATANLYVPQSCTVSGAHCKVHVVLHGCTQAPKYIDAFYAESGYNNWADSNNILVLYPQVDTSPTGPNTEGCWDWWGYTGSNYAQKSGLQMKAILAMVQRLVQPP
jgi:poly(3-hydroxybutyrate) depolymerase